MIKSLYIHLPFCKSICPYCDFFKRVSSHPVMEEYYLSLKEELNLIKEELKDLETIYIGGGTPTSFIYLEDFLKDLKNSVNLKKIKEFTIETTPRDLKDFALKIFQEYYINRVSIGVESFNEETLKYLKRSDNHFEEVEDVVKRLRKSGINNINLDLIYGLPYETRESINRSLDYIKEINPSHVSFYDLIVEEKTILFKDLKDHKISLASEDENIKMRDLIEKKLALYGYKRYEISNFAKPNFESIHNKAYWQLQDYISIGAGAHSLVDNKRYSNTTNLKTYALLANNKDLNSIREYYETSFEKEYFIMGLRMTKGVSFASSKEELLSKYKGLQQVMDEGLVLIDGNNIRLTDKGFHFANRVFRVFI